MNSDEYLNLITSQHRMPNFLETVRASIEPLIDCIQFLNETSERFDINSAKGLPLQIIADWVGADKSVPNSIPIPFFGFKGQPDSLPMSEQVPEFMGGYYRESGVSGYRATTMSESLFKEVVKAKIKLNHSDCSLDSAKEIIEMVTSKKFKIIDNLNMTVTFEFLESHDIFDQELVKMMFPTPAGVRLIFGNEDDY